MKFPSIYAIEVKGVYKHFADPASEKFRLRTIFLSPKKLMAIRKKQESLWALDDISFSVLKGEFFGILGRNGSGKSTLLKMLAGIYQPTKGKISIEGSILPFIELGVGFNPELSGIDNIFLNGAMLGLQPREIKNKLEEIVSFSELGDAIALPLKNYSSGMQVRLAFSIATMVDVPILLVDEVLAVGDTAFQKKCFDFFKKLKTEKKTVVFVTHDMHAVREYCDRAILIDEHRIIAEGSAESIAEKYDGLFVNPAGKKRDVELSAESTNNPYAGNLHAKFSNTHAAVIISETSREEIEICTQLEALRDIAEINAGFLLENSEGLKILGTNSELAKKKIKNIKQGETVTLRWRFIHLLNPGDYHVAVAATNIDGSVIFDWQQKACSLHVKRSISTPYPVNPPIDMTIDVHPAGVSIS